MPEKRDEAEGRYLYCVAGSREELTLGEIGLGDAEVYTIPSGDLCAVVHECSPEPYDSDDEEEVKRWVKSHQRVMDKVMEDPRFSGIVPAGFDTIVQAKEDRTARENVSLWLKKESNSLLKQLQEVKNREEYGVQIMYDPDWLEAKVSKKSEEFRSLREKIESKPEGAAYLYEEKLKKLLKEKRGRVKERLLSKFYEMITPTVSRVKQEDNKDRLEEKKMLLNLSCLVKRAEYEELGAALEDIEEREGVSVRFTGPWAPFSFTELKNAEGD
ncbi:GvpL/GvpF family gas vesicle protein [Candidatus Bipolaricaulota bacterium]|nr:GvpL/GvpF family gas vesicle protein [Candidatus Bipolaricaulota bacterium]